MKMRYVDFLSDEEYRTLESRNADFRMYLAGLGCLAAMVALCIGFIIL